MPRARCLACLLPVVWAPVAVQGWEQPFGPPQTIGAFSDPEAVRLADLDGDGDLDVVAAGADGVAWWREQGGIYLPTAVSAAAAADVAVADLDGDGDLDLVAASPAAGLTFFRNTAGDGSAWSSVAVQSAVVGIALALGDVDGDGRLDVVAALNGTVEWWRNSAGDGSVWARQTIAPFAGASGVALGDLDRDGALDVVATADGATDAVAYFPNTLGWPRTDVATGVDGARGPRIADLDGDGFLDVVAAASVAGEILWYRNDGSPANGFPGGLQLAVAAGARVGEPVDLDLDGGLDLLVADAAGASWLDVEDPQASAAVSYAIDAAGDLRAVAAGDLDGDGDLEVITAGAADDELRLWPNASQHRVATWRPQLDLLTAFDGARGLAAGDLDGDGDLDLVATATVADQVVWLESTAGGWVQQTIETLNGAFKLALGDLDGDGDLDVLAAADAANTVAWWRNDLAVGGGFVRRNVDTLLLGARGVAVGDMDRDGDLDVVAGGTSDDIAVYRNDGAAAPAFVRQFITTTFNRVHDVQVADLDGDGDLDVVAAGHTADEVAWWENVDGIATTWSAKQTISGITLDGGFSVHAADLDRDGDVDVLSTADQSDETTFWENTSGDGAAWAEHTLPYLNQPQSAIAADLDADGDLDVVATAYKDGGKVSAIRNLDGIGHTWQRIDLTVAYDGACTVAVADFDQDGRLDIVAAAETVDKVALWSNGGGQVALTGTSTAATLPANTETALFKLVLTPRGLPTENEVELATVALALEEAPGDPLSSAEAAALFQAIEIVRDNATGGVVGSLDGTDVTVGAFTRFPIDAGTLVLELPDGAPSAAVAQGASATFFVAAQTVASYAAVPLTGVRLRQLGARSRVEDRTHDAGLRPEWTMDPQSPAFPLNSLADLAVTLEDGADPVVAGATLSYQIEVANQGPSSASGTTLTLDLPDGATLVATDGCAEDPAGAPTCSLGTLATGATATVSVQIAVAAGAAAPLELSVVVASSAHDPQTGDNQASESTAVIASADLAVEIVSRRDYGDGQPLELQVLVRNLGPGPAIDAAVTVDLPAALEGAVYSCSGSGGGTCGAGGSGDIADVVDLPSGAIVTYRIHGTVSDGLTAPLAAAATVAVGGATQDATPANNAASVSWIWGNPLFYDGFESGALGAWSAHTP